MVNKKQAHCRQCWKGLEPGEGAKWEGRIPAWANNRGGYLCDGCRPVWSAWAALYPALVEYRLLASEWIVINMAREPVWFPSVSGTMDWCDSQAALQTILAQAVYDGTGLAAGAVAKHIARFFETMADAPRDWQEIAEIIWSVRAVVLARVSETMVIPGIKVEAQ